MPSDSEDRGRRTEDEHRGGPSAGAGPGRGAPAEVHRAGDGAVGAGQEESVGVHCRGPLRHSYACVWCQVWRQAARIISIYWCRWRRGSDRLAWRRTTFQQRGRGVQDTHDICFFFFPGNLRTTMVYGYSIFSEIITLYMACLPLPVTPGGVAAGGIAPEHQEADERTAASSVRPSLHHVTTSAQRTLQFRRLTRQRSFLLVLDYTNQERNVLPASVRCWRKGTGVEAIHLT